MTNQCPCGSGISFKECCGPIISGNIPAPTAERLMRSRYTAFTLADADYLIRSWAPETRNIQEKEALRNWARSVRWVKLKILNTTAGSDQDLTGTVTFQAYFREKGKLDQIAEESFFEKRNGAWLYVSGKYLN